MSPGISVSLIELVRPARINMVFFVFLESHLIVIGVFEMDKTVPKDFSPYLVANLEG